MDILISQMSKIIFSRAYPEVFLAWSLLPHDRIITSLHIITA